MNAKAVITPAMPKPTRAWFQFSLRTLLVLMTSVAAGLGWLAYERQKAERQEEAVLALQKLGGYVFKKKLQDRVPASVRTLLGDDNYLALVDLTYTEVTDQELANLSALRRVYGLNLRATKVTDTGLKVLPELKMLQYLDLQGTHITDAGLERLAGMKQVIILDVSGTPVTDAGLVHLGDLTELSFLGLAGTQVTDAGLVHLAGLSQLKKLTLDKTQVTEEGVARLQRALPNLEIVR